MIKRNYYVVLDASGSMCTSKCSGERRKIDVAKRGAAAVRRRTFRPTPTSACLVFDEQGIRALIPLGPLDREASLRAMRAVVAGRRHAAAQRDPRGLHASDAARGASWAMASITWSS